MLTQHVLQYFMAADRGHAHPKDRIVQFVSTQAKGLL